MSLIIALAGTACAQQLTNFDFGDEPTRHDKAAVVFKKPVAVGDTAWEIFMTPASFVYNDALVYSKSYAAAVPTFTSGEVTVGFFHPDGGTLTPTGDVLAVGNAAYNSGRVGCGLFYVKVWI